MNQPDVFQGYAADAAELIPSFEALSTTEVLAPVADLLPAQPCRVLEVGAGTGRDASWFAEQGHAVLAVEPVRELREAGIGFHPSANLAWLDDRLPGLDRVRATGARFDLILAIAVWQHLPPARHLRAVESLAELTAQGGRIIISLRHGPGSPTRPCFLANPEQIVRYAQTAGLTLIASREAPSVQQRNRDAGVTWTWLCLDRL